MEIHYNIKDIFRAPRSALSITKILIFAQANTVGFVAYLIANYLALLLSGFSLIDIWKSHGVFLCANTYELKWYASLFFGLAQFIGFWLSTDQWRKCQKFLYKN